MCGGYIYIYIHFRCSTLLWSSLPGNRDTCTWVNVKSADALDRGMFVSSSKLLEPIIPRFYLVILVVCVCVCFCLVFFFPQVSDFLFLLFEGMWYSKASVITNGPLIYHQTVNQSFLFFLFFLFFFMVSAGDLAAVVEMFSDLHCWVGFVFLFVLEHMSSDADQLSHQQLLNGNGALGFL